MKHIYLVKFETIRAFTSPRKAVEYAQQTYGDFEVPRFDHDENGNPITLKEKVALNDFKTKDLIKELNNEYFITASDYPNEISIQKIEVN